MPSWDGRGFVMSSAMIKSEYRAKEEEADEDEDEEEEVEEGEVR